MRPKLLDLFCGAGGCSVGLHEVNPKSLHATLKLMLAYLEEMIDKRDVECDDDADPTA